MDYYGYMVTYKFNDEYRHIYHETLEEAKNTKEYLEEKDYDEIEIWEKKWTKIN